MFEELQARRDELLAILAKMETQSKAAKDAAEREKIDAAAWLVVARIWLYRGTGLLALSRHKGQICNYLDYHIKEAKLDIKNGYNVENNRELLSECKIAKKILQEMPDVPLF